MEETEASDRLVEALRASSDAAERVREAFDGGSRQSIEDALAALDQAEDERERATVARGWTPAWPPRTDEGRAKYGLTAEQVQEIISRSR